ncbi:MAG: hypothetical protein LC659_03620, partial [Myxococcales bacterium]|nr:hypothetical protein [Myxococcales bacterium]
MTTRPGLDAGSCYAALRELGHTGDNQIADFQREWTLPATGILDATTTAVIVDALAAHRLGERQKQIAPRNAVVGHVADGSGAPAPGLEVHIIEQRFRDEVKVAATRTDDDGRYEAAYPRAAAKAKNAIIVRVLDGEAVAAQSPPQFTVPVLLTLDLTVEASHARPRSEYEKLAAAVGDRIGTTPIEQLAAKDVAFLAGSTAFPANQLALLVVAASLAAKHGIDGAFFYALFREGTLLGAGAAPIAARFAVDLETPIEPLYYDIVLVDDSARRAAVQHAIARRIVPAALSRELESIAGVLAESEAAANQYRSVQQPHELVRAAIANLVAGTQQEIAAAVQTPTGGDPQAIAARFAAIP